MCGEAVTLVLPLSARARVAALWELADRGASADELLDAVLSEGVRALSDLVLVSEHDETLRVIVRGSVTAVVSTPESEVTVAAVPGTIWNEQLFAGASGVRVSLGGDTVADSALRPGITRISLLEVDTSTRASRPGLDEVEAPTTHPQHAEPASTQPEQRVGRVEPEAASEPEAEASPSRVVPFRDDWPDRDGHTQAAVAPPEFTRPPVPGQEQAPPVLSRPVAKLVFSTGDVVDVDRVILAGRAPEARRFASHDQPRLLTLPSPHQEISSTHLEVRPGAGADHGMAIVTDLGSTNGTVLMQPGLPAEDLRPGIAVSLVPGAVLDLGDGVTIQVTNP